MTIRTLLVEDNARYRAGLETLLEHADGFTLVHSFGAAEPALAELERRQETERAIQLVLMDIELPGVNGIEAGRRIKCDHPQVAVVMLTVFEEPSVILEAISAGADGYLLKRSSAQELLSQLRAIVRGGAPLSAGVARTVLELLRNPAVLAGDGPPQDPPTRLDLTPREQDVLRGLVRGLSYQGTADALGIGIETVRTHIRSIYRKLQVHTVAEAVRRAVRERLV